MRLKKRRNVPEWCRLEKKRNVIKPENNVSGKRRESSTSPWQKLFIALTFILHCFLRVPISSLLRKKHHSELQKLWYTYKTQRQFSSTLLCCCVLGVAWKCERSRELNFFFALSRVVSANTKLPLESPWSFEKPFIATTRPCFH